MVIKVKHYFYRTSSCSDTDLEKTIRYTEEMQCNETAVHKNTYNSIYDYHQTSYSLAAQKQQMMK